MANKTRIKQEVVARYDLITGQDTYASATAQNPLTSRKILSWLPSDDGALHRELAQPKFLPTQLSGPVVGLYQFNWNTGDGTIQRFQFCVARTDFVLGTRTCNFYENYLGAWVFIATISPLADAPMCKQLGNIFHISDGVTNWIFDGTAVFKEGLPFPSNPPGVAVSNCWLPGQSYAFIPVAAIVDSNGNIQYTSSVGSSGQKEPVWKTTIGATTTDSGVTWTCLGPPVAWQANHAYTTFAQAIVDTVGYIQTVSTAGTSGNDTPAFKQQLNTTTVDGTATWTCIGAFPVGQNNDTLNHVFSGSAVRAANDVLIDTNGNVQVATTAGTSGQSNPTWGRALGDTTVDNTVTWTNFGQAIQIQRWRAGLVSAIHSVILDSFGNYQVAQTGGTSGSTTPTWAKTYGATTSDGSVTWINKGQRASGKTISGAVGRYYWTTFSHESTFCPHQSDTSPISISSGPLKGQVTRVFQQRGRFGINNGSSTVSVSINVTDQPTPQTPLLTPDLIGLDIWIDGQLVGTITAVNQNAKTLTVNAVWAGSSIPASPAVILPFRATHWHLYASESDGSKVGFLLAILPREIAFYDDTSPFDSDTANLFTLIYRPVRNDQPPPSKLLEVHKYRLWRRRETKPNFFLFSANEEVASGNNGAPWESVPGADANTLSDIVNEVSFPDQSTSIRAFISHSDALYMFSEKQAFPLYGQSIDDFTILQVTAFNRGIAGRFAGKSTPHGLPFISYDRKALLYPSASTPSANASDLLVEFGIPMRNVLDTIDSTRLDEVVTEFYYFGKRNWFVLGFPNESNVWSTYVYDFSTHGWFQLQRGMSSLAVFETADGSLILVGGAPDGFVYVIDDLSGTYVSVSNLPIASWRPALIDFGAPTSQHVIQYVEMEFSNPALVDNLTVTFWLDPLDVDNPGEGRQITMTPIRIGSNRFRGFTTGGTTCHRVLFDFTVAASQNNGTIRGVKLVAKPYAGLTT